MSLIFGQLLRDRTEFDVDGSTQNNKIAGVPQVSAVVQVSAVICPPNLGSKPLVAKNLPGIKRLESELVFTMFKTRF
jgi:hypothetical protein